MCSFLFNFCKGLLMHKMTSESLLPHTFVIGASIVMEWILAIDEYRWFCKLVAALNGKGFLKRLLEKFKNATHFYIVLFEIRLFQIICFYVAYIGSPHLLTAGSVTVQRYYSVEKRDLWALLEDVASAASLRICDCNMGTWQPTHVVSCQLQNPMVMWSSFATFTASFPEAKSVGKLARIRKSQSCDDLLNDQGWTI